MTDLQLMQNAIGEALDLLFKLCPGCCPRCHGMQDLWVEVPKSEPVLGAQVYRIGEPSHLLKQPATCGLPHWVRMKCPVCQGVETFSPSGSYPGHEGEVQGTTRGQLDSKRITVVTP